MVAWSGLRETFSVLFPLVALTDAVDGWLARRLYQQSDAGRRLDSVADAAFFYSAPLWFWRLVPETASTWWPWIAMPAVPFFAG
ncbi:MAG: CDP-alcohol phosphatidyltransferase family protein, partial [Armatimonadota bacterium]|nr:CDP-alcohol phosphatidyltransferase family protein [Armatimonadota bacterium]